MEANSYEKMVQEEKSRRGELTSTPNVSFLTSEVTSTFHKFQQTFYKQESFEPRRFLGFKFNKKVGEQIIPVGLCATCDKLEIEHNE